MANVYPTINAAGIVTGFPYQEDDEFVTHINTLDCGISYAQPQNTTPLKRFTLTYPIIEVDEVAVIENFFKSMRGDLGQFTFTDDAGNSWTNTRFDMDTIVVIYNEWNSQTVTVKLSATLNSFVPFDPNLGDSGSDSGPTQATQET